MEIKFEPEEISSILKKQIETYQITVDMEEVGEVIEAGDGIARIKGLPNCMSVEMLEFPNNIFGMALNLEEDNIGAMILGDFAEIEQADTRSWITLPSSIWIARIPVEPGVYEVGVRPEGSSATVSLGRVAVRGGERVFRSCRVFGGPHPVRCDEPRGGRARRHRG